MNVIFDKLFKQLTDGYFVDIDPDGNWHNTNYLNIERRWHGICICDVSNINKNNNAFIYSSYDLKNCLIQSNHSGIIHYLSINKLENLDYIKLFINTEYVNNHMSWRRHILYSSVNLKNIYLKDELIELYKNNMNLELVDFTDCNLIFVNKLFTCLV